jgi:hypothetical protein
MWPHFNLPGPNDDYDLSFLQSIEEVSGYVLIYSVYAQDLHLRNLKLIRGSQLYSLTPGEKLYSLVVASNSDWCLTIPKFNQMIKKETILFIILINSLLLIFIRYH